MDPIKTKTKQNCILSETSWRQGCKTKNFYIATKKNTPPPPIRFKNCYPHFFQFQIKSNSKQYLHPLHITAVVTLLCATHQTSCENKNKEKKTHLVHMRCNHNEIAATVRTFQCNIDENEVKCYVENPSEF